MAHVRIYTTSTCGYCWSAKRLLKSKGVPFEEIDVSGDWDKRRWLAQVTGRRTVPQVFIDHKPYGGYSDLAELEREGRLDRVLGLDAA
jgi:glutaredoxin 3